MVKIRFKLGENSWHGSATETLWAEEIATGQFRLKNTPFFARGVSFCDVVLATPTARDGEFSFVEAIRRGGHSTYRLLPGANWESGFEAAWGALAALGCTFEEGPSRLKAVDVPPATDIFAAYRAMEAGEAAEVWAFEEGHCGHSIA